jgi:hypothetical protein
MRSAFQGPRPANGEIKKSHGSLKIGAMGRLDIWFPVSRFGVPLALVPTTAANVISGAASGLLLRTSTLEAQQTRDALFWWVRHVAGRIRNYSR